MVGSVVDWSERNWQARCIYGLIKRYQHDIEHVIDDALEIENFENGRERGYTIRYKDKEVSFAENRNSDDIVVYPFPWEKVDKECDRKDAKFFKLQQFHKVFNYLLDYLGIEL